MKQQPAAAEMMAAQMNENSHWKWIFSFKRYMVTRYPFLDCDNCRLTRHQHISRLAIIHHRVKQCLFHFSWLREFTHSMRRQRAKNSRDRLTMLGLELEEIVNPFANIAREIVVGHVAPVRGASGFRSSALLQGRYRLIRNAGHSLWRAQCRHRTRKVAVAPVGSAPCRTAPKSRRQGCAVNLRRA